MEILTLVREDIRHKKGAFRSILLLTIVITMSFSTVISLRDNNYRSVEKAFSDTDTGDIMALILDVNYSDELIEKVENVSSVEKSSLVKSSDPVILLSFMVDLITSPFSSISNTIFSSFKVYPSGASFSNI